MAKTPMQETASFLIYRVGRLLRYKAAAFLAEYGRGVSPEQWTVLLRLHEQGDSAMGDLADPVLEDHPNLTRLVAGLKDMGLVDTIRNPGDGRSRLAALTREGKDFVAGILPDLIEAKARFYDGLNQREVTTLITLLKVVENNFES